MDIFNIDLTSQKLFRNLLPEANLSLIRSGEVVTLGALESAAAVGVLQFYIDRWDNAIVSYFFVDSSYRRENVGMLLFLRLFRILEDSGAHFVETVAAGDEDDPGLARFMKKAGFQPDHMLGVFHAPLSFWLDSAMMTVPEDRELIRPLEELTRIERGTLLQALFATPAPAKNGLVDEEAYEERVSCYFDEEGAKGCILVGCRTDHSLEVLRFGMKGSAPKARLLQLIQAALISANTLYSSDTLILIRCRKEQDRRLIEKLWPGAGIYERYAYARELDEPVEELY
ncbi:MAG: GNAT family N-acetyltransferase [Lachnospiraceae bacterium]|nr:GNAT family N-acetyltransferase [Lachnospiraceae bacterium]